MESLAITFVGLIQILAIWAAFQLGRQQERPESKWPTGSMLAGGWKAWRLPYIIIVATAAFTTIFIPILAGGTLGNMFGGLFEGGGGYSRGGRYSR